MSGLVRTALFSDHAAVVVAVGECRVEDGQVRASGPDILDL
nr:hypothetical protein [Mycobacterium uberis]